MSKSDSSNINNISCWWAKADSLMRRLFTATGQSQLFRAMAVSMRREAKVRMHWTGSFTEQLLIWMKFSYQWFFSWIMPLASYLKSHPHTQGHSDFLLCYLSTSFIVLHFAFMSMVHFEVIFVKSKRSLPRFNSLFCMWMSVILAPSVLF